MKTEMEGLGAKLLSNLGKALEYGNIDEYDFVPVIEASRNKNPLVVVDNKIGIEIWAVKVLFEYAYDKLLDFRKSQIKIKDYNELVDLSQAVLMVNADNQTAWNIRKELISLGALKERHDLQIGALILRKHPKSPETFAHRKWVLLHRIQAVPDPLLLDSEFAVCTKAGDAYANNYNAWNHRLWVVEHLAKWNTQVIRSELKKTEAFVTRHVSDHSGFHFRQVLLQKLPPCDASVELDHEMALLCDLILRYPGHEALWYHRRAVLHQILTNQEAVVSYSRKVHQSETEKQENSNKRWKICETDVIFNHEEKLCDDFVSKVQDDVDWQRTLAHNYKRWLSCVKKRKFP